MGLIMNKVDLYLEGIQEGKKWDAVKKVWRDHRGKIIGAGLAAGAAYGIYRGAKAGAAYTKDVLDKNIEKKKKEEEQKIAERLKKAKDLNRSGIAANAIKKKNKETRMNMGTDAGYIPSKERTLKMTPYVNKYKENRETAKKERTVDTNKKYENPYKKAREESVEKRRKEKENEAPSYMDKYRNKVADSVKKSHEKRLELEKNKK